MDNAKKVKEEIANILNRNHDLTIKDVIFGFSDWLAFITTKEKHAMSIFFDKYLQWFLHYGINFIDKSKDK